MNLESFSCLCDCSAISEYMQHACNIFLNMHETCMLHAFLPAPVQYSHSLSSINHLKARVYKLIHYLYTTAELY